MKDEYIKKFYDEVCQNLDGNYKIILEPPRNLNEDWIEYDTVKWELEDKMKELIDTLIKNKSITLEEKIIKVYEFICMNYIYDANVVYFFKGDVIDQHKNKYISVDLYGRVVGKE